MIPFISIQSHWILAFSLNFILICLGQRFPLLTPSGWIHAGILGTILWGCLGWSGWTAVVIYLFLGSFVTKIGFAYKQSAGIEESRGGRRGPENVWGSAATGALIAILIGMGVSSRELLLIGFSASFAAKLADTFGSELGKRWGKKAFLITTFRSVAPGTDGAISLQGTLASILGSLVMTIAIASLSLVNGLSSLFIVFISGVLATLLESFIGAVLQKQFIWLSNELVNFIQTTFAALLAICLASLIV
tara:strand:+ start:8603 stop:9346 length:744 start_codon:yes stop_codon:yes gene_type:complete